MAQLLIQLMARREIRMALPKYIPTLQQSRTKSWTRPDNVFVSEGLLNSVTACDGDTQKRPPLADHLPILTSIDISQTTHTPQPRHKWHSTDWEEFNETLIVELANIPSETRLHPPKSSTRQQTS
jgi:hypothetical protein